MPAPRQTTPGEVLDLVGEAVQAGKARAEHNRLVILHRVLSEPTNEVAAELGRPAGTVRRRRSRAEAATARLVLRSVG